MVRPAAAGRHRGTGQEMAGLGGRGYPGPPPVSAGTGAGRRW